MQKLKQKRIMLAKGDETANRIYLCIRRAPKPQTESIYAFGGCRNRKQNLFMLSEGVETANVNVFALSEGVETANVNTFALSEGYETINRIDSRFRRATKP